MENSNMSDGRKNNGGARKGAGNPGYGRLKFIRDNVEKYQGVWWQEIVRMMQEGDKDEKRFAMSEFNKLQTKMIPQDITSGGKELPTPILGTYVRDDNSNETYNVNEGENTSSSRRDISE